MQRSDEVLRLATFNGHGAVGPDGRCDRERLLRAIAGFEADILALQEVDGRTRYGRMPRAFEYLAVRLGGFRVEARTLGPLGEEHGHILWSRHRIAASFVHELPASSRWETRKAIEALIVTPLGPLTVLSAHLSLSPLARRRQAAFLAERAAAAPGPVVVMGDFNEWRRKGPVHRCLSRVTPHEAQGRSWPARHPLAPFDRIYASEELAIRDAWLDPRAAVASDHLALLADIARGAPV